MASGSSPATLAAILALLLLSPARATKASVATPETAAALDQVCGRLGGYYVTPALCASALCADATLPCRAARDAPAVAALAARLAADNATAAMDSIQAAVLASPSSPTGPAANSSSAAASAAAASAAAARSCLQLCAGAVPALRWAARAVAAGRYRGAREVLQAAQYVAAGCEGMAGDAAGAALPRENGGFGDMAFVTHAVVASMAAD
ncbi:unnamed protein product [Urochloa humidicola]